MEEATGRQGDSGTEAVSLDSRDRDSNQEKLEGFRISETPQAPSRTTLSPADTDAAQRAHSWGQV